MTFLSFLTAAAAAAAAAATATATTTATTTILWLSGFCPGLPG